ncbi:hypothetical protein [Halalkalicoccus ordinarius]|uniref:hypothetical protein n=1 Tax=Halalkalicoccus ordinarius TaxID=3116651 RepID=UPI00300F6FC8
MSSDSTSDPDGETEVAAAEDPQEPTENRRGLSDRTAFWTSLLLSIVIAVGSIWVVGRLGDFFEALQRVRPTIEGGGVGAEWVRGNTLPALEWLITLVHFADVIMGVFILVMVFIHWIAFRRLAARMRPPDAPRRSSDAVATDGGERSFGSQTVENERDQPAEDEPAGRRGGDSA